MIPVLLKKKYMCTTLVFPFTGEFTLFRDVADFLQQFYYGEESSRKLDRIIFVASARSRELPHELIRALITQAMGGRRGKHILYLVQKVKDPCDFNPLFLVRRIYSAFCIYSLSSHRP